MACPSLAPFDLYGWRPDPALTDDENLMDIVLLLTRSSTSRTSGRVACVLVDPAMTPRPIENENMRCESVEELELRLFGCIVGAAINQPLFSPVDSDIHAEISCLGQACNSRHAVQGCTAYITIHPCKRCFAALVAFGIGRIVSRQMAPKQIVDCAHTNGIEVAELTKDMNRRQMKRINDLVAAATAKVGENASAGQQGCRTDDELMEYVAQRKKWRDQKRQEKKLASTQREGKILADADCSKG